MVMDCVCQVGQDKDLSTQNSSRQHNTPSRQEGKGIPALAVREADEVDREVHRLRVN